MAVQPSLIFSFTGTIGVKEEDFNPPRQEVEEIDVSYIAQTQLPKFDQHPDYLDEKKRDEYLRNNKLRLLRDYQLGAIVRAVKSSISEGKDRFLLEMATGTGKPLPRAQSSKCFCVSTTSRESYSLLTA